MYTYIIAEAGVNHNGNLETALKLCDSAKEAGANAIKFQTWITEKVITKTVKQADYQSNNTGVSESQFDMLKKLELPFEDFKTIKEYCDKIGIDFASTADEPESLDFLLSLGIPFIKIGSGDMCNIPFLRYIGGKSLLTGQIVSAISRYCGDVKSVIDVFAGSGVVSGAFKAAGYKVYSNDCLYISTTCAISMAGQ